MLYSTSHRSNTVHRGFFKATRRLGLKVQAGLLEVGQTLYVESQKLVPRDTEALGDSGRVSQIGSLLDTVVVVGYGGKDFPPRTEISKKDGRTVTRIPSEYAVLVHEVPAPHDAGQQHDYLREPCGKLMELQQAFRAAARV